MESRGRGGRGRGRRKNDRPSFASVTMQGSSSSSLSHQNCEPAVSRNDTVAHPRNDGAHKFKEARAQMQQSVQRFASQEEEYESSSEEEIENQDGILNNLITAFTGGGDSATGELGRTQQFLRDAFKSGACVCLVCIATIKKTDPVWSCEVCYGMFHLPCIQKWAKDSIFCQEQAMQDDTLPKNSLMWFCPKCRCEYPQNKKPVRYLCFCGKEVDPKLDPWLMPHTCGERCDKPLKPVCGHVCLLLCHPGPCPPCPKTIRASCFCGAQQPQMKRCSAREWSCGQPCKRQLLCGQHPCAKPCHAGDCDACPWQSRQPCMCGGDVSQRPCASPSWQCGKVCGQKLSCGHHACDQVCHAGPCGDCPKTGERSCPCGKTISTLPCTEDVPTCGDTCGKLLACGVHNCSQRCHTGPCGMCLQMRVKRCQCGHREKSVPCHKEYRCEIKCKKMRDCNRHACNRKCCDGDCPACEQHCSRTLGCRNHKCSSLCHQGSCYPCPLTSEVKCNCGATSITVPCGRERLTKPPKCAEMCKSPPNCHHAKRTPHRCHFGSCPPCQQTCLKNLPRCNHTCAVKCHAAVLVKTVDETKRQGPWEPTPVPKFEIVNQRCPRCRVLIPVTCLGLHETGQFFCSEARPYSCFQQCGRQLVCTSHQCSLPCHQVTNAPDVRMAGDDCEVCERPCSRPRPPGCTHECLRSCHPEACAPCKQMVKLRCHCQLNTLYVECSKWTSSKDDIKTELLSCKNQCPKNMTCGHRCYLLCHTGTCQTSSNCKKKMTFRCPCKRMKKDIACHLAGTTKIECDTVCKEQNEMKLKAKEEEEMRKKAEESKQAEEELNKFLQKSEGKKRRQRKTREVVEETSFLEEYKNYMIVSVAVLILAVFSYGVMSMS